MTAWLWFFFFIHIYILHHIRKEKEDKEKSDVSSFIFKCTFRIPTPHILVYLYTEKQLQIYLNALLSNRWQQEHFQFNILKNASPKINVEWLRHFQQNDSDNLVGCW